MKTRLRPVAIAAVALILLLVLATMAWLVLRPRGARIDDHEMRRVGGLSVGVTTAPEAPQVGSNRLWMRVEHGGQPARGLDIDAVVFMSAMGSMPYMESRPRMREVRPGLFEGEYSLVMGGSWDIDLRLHPRNGEEARAALRLTFGSAGVSWVSAEGATGSAADSSVEVGEAILLSARRRQEIGVTTERVERRFLEHARRIPGRVTFDETRLTEVTARTGGYVRELFADFTGSAVRRGSALLTLYSPEIYAAQQEYVAALAARDGLPTGPARDRAEELAGAARQRLLLWNLPGGVVDELGRTRVARETVPVVSPVHGVVIEKTVIEGGAVQTGQTLYRIAPLDPIWIVADVYAYELPLLRVGQPARVSLPQGSGASRSARVAYLFPTMSSDTRTAAVRLEVSNRDLALRPEMFVDVELRIPLGERIAVPASAVLYGGERRIVFVDVGGGRLEPRDVRLGPQAGDYYPVESGLSDGDVVVTAGNFLVAAESRLRSATRRF